MLDYPKEAVLAKVAQALKLLEEGGQDSVLAARVVLGVLKEDIEVAEQIDERGISYIKTYDRWEARIQVAGESLYLGRHRSKEAAYAAVLAARLERGLTSNPKSKK